MVGSRVDLVGQVADVGCPLELVVGVCRNLAKLSTPSWASEITEHCLLCLGSRRSGQSGRVSGVTSVWLPLRSGAPACRCPGPWCPVPSRARAPPGPGWPSPGVTRLAGSPSRAVTGPGGHLPGQPALPRCPAARRPAAQSCARTGGEAGYLLGERRLRAARIVAEQPPDLQPDHHPPPADRRIGQPPLIAAVHPPRTSAAHRAHRGAGPGTGPDAQQRPGRFDPVHDDCGQVRQEHFKIVAMLA